MYQNGQTAESTPGQDSSSGTQTGSNTSDVTDVEYEEVNDKK
jgi:hypothetical protein